MTHSSTVVRSRALAAVAALVGLVIGLLPASPASAAPAAPTGLAPSSGSVTGIPTLSWTRVAGASSYSVDVATSATFSQVLFHIDTASRFAVPTTHLPKTADGSIYWRVRANGDSGAGPWATASFARGAVGGPALLSPQDDASLVQPTDPALLSWTAIDGATDYKVEVDTETNFIEPREYHTQTTSLLVPDPDVATVYFWRVTATQSSGSVTEPSDTRRFRVLGLAKPVLVGPTDEADTPVPDGDVVLEWRPVAGAARYNVQVSTDRNFPANGETQNINGIVGTMFSPPTTFGNDQYYWRVQPVDAGGHQLDWDNVDVWHFQRSWPDQPVLEHPANNSTTVGQAGDALFYQWTAVPHAAWYRVQLSLTSTFNTIYKQCDTKQTTLVPAGNECLPQSLESVYWRVIAYDDGCSLGCAETPHTDAILSATGRFTYNPTLVRQTSPSTSKVFQADEVPVFTWQTADNMARYRVTLTNTDNQWTYVKDTASLSLVPRDVLPPGHYRWQVQTLSDSGVLGPGLLLGGQPQFEVATTLLGTPAGAVPVVDPSPAVGHRMPLLTWRPVTGAKSYRVLVRPQGTLLWHYLDGWFAYPGAAYETIQGSGYDLLGPDTYEWMVEAYSDRGAVISDNGGAPGTYRIVPLDSPVGRRVALTGIAASSPATSCAATLPTKCQDLRQSPVLRWDPVTDAGAYLVYLSRDKEMTNVLAQYTTSTQQTMWTHPELLPDSQAGSAYYWTVKPCVTSQACNAMEHAGNAFNKLSNQVELTGETTKDTITFRWKDFLAVNTDGTVAHLDGTGTSARQEAARYQLQVSTVPNFESLVDDIVVDETTYTAFNRTYPEGPLYWRVRPFDGSGNMLGWSDARGFRKASDHPRLVSPAGGTDTDGAPALRWSPMDYASSYDVEVYRGVDLIGQPANRAIVGNVRQTAYAHWAMLPPGSYSWRVRRIDSGGRPGPWSPLDPAELGATEHSGLFRVSSTTPTPKSPTNGTTVAGNEAVFTWQPVPSAAWYRWQRRNPTNGDVMASIDTRALSWAANDVVPAGRWTWSVTAFDVNNQELGTSPQWAFTVGSASAGGGTGGTGPGAGTGGGTGTGTGPSSDTVRPQVKAFKPASGQKIKRTASVTVIFTEPVTRVTTSSLLLTLKGVKVKASVTLSADGRKAVLKPSKKLKAKKSYVLKVTTGVRDRAGNPLVAASASFKTKS